MKRVLKWLIYFFACCLLLIMIGISYLYISTKQQMSGTISLKGLHGKVAITRDQYGIPHIHAYKNDNDAFFALGFAHAQDRFWQMEFQRHVVRGELSVLFGKNELNDDKILRTLGFYRAAKQVLPAFDLKTKQLIHSYTMGVNAFLKTQHLPLELKLLHHKPKPWTDVDTVAWQKLMAWDLQHTWEDKIRNYFILHQLGKDKLKQLALPYPANAPTILSQKDLAQSNLLSHLKTQYVSQTDIHTSLSNTDLQAVKEFLSLAKQLNEDIGMHEYFGKGSNNWVIAGNKTVTGKPLLADDPHLELEAPPLWYLAEIKGPHVHVIGATIPGAPGVVIGHNDHIAWGVTNVQADTQDLYIESADAPLKTITETIHIRGSKPVKFNIYISKHGPIINTLLKKGVKSKKLLAHPIALKWTALQPGDTTVQSLIYIDYAENWKEFTRALRYFVSPSQNFVYADTQGNIGYYMPGKIPIREGWSGEFPVAPFEKKEWAGFIPFEKLPHVFNPPEGFIASANNKVVPNTYPYQLTYRWQSPPYRIERLKKLIHRYGVLDMDKMKQIQNDIVSDYWTSLKPVLLKTKPLDQASQQALNILSKWNGEIALDSIAATVFAYWYRELNQISPPPVKLYRKFPYGLLIQEQLLKKGEFCKTKRNQNCSVFLSTTLKHAMQTLVSTLGDNKRNWQWGKIHRAEFKALGFGRSEQLGWIWNRSIASPGGYYTLNVGTYAQKNFHQIDGPSYRQIIDLSNLNNSLYIQTLGQSGNPFNRHYQDQMQYWRDGKYLSMTTNKKSQYKEDVLTLMPQT